MFAKKPNHQLRATLAVASSMCSLWVIGVVALTIVSWDAGPRYPEEPVNFRHQASGVTHAYRDVTGRYTVYIRGTQRLFAP